MSSKAVLSSEEAEPTRILIVDDEPKNLTVLETVLDDPRYSLVRADSADQALLALVQDDFALIILDVRMPGMTGFELAQMIKERKKTAHVPIIFMTAYYNEDQHVLEGYGTGAVDYLYKPVNATVLRSKVSVFAKLHRYHRALALEVAERRRIEHELYELNETLEQRVVERTDALQQRTEELVKANRALEKINAELDSFAYAASHDLKEPLRMVGIYSQLLQRKYGERLDAQADEYLNFAVRGAKRMEALVADLLSYTQVVNGNEHDVFSADANAALDQALVNLKAAREESGADIQQTDLPKLMVQQVHLVQLFQNLIGNAIKYRAERTPVVQITTLRDGSMWKLCIHDNGIGIDPKYREQVFGLFKRLHNSDRYTGTGIGLALCKKIVNR